MIDPSAWHVQVDPSAFVAPSATLVGAVQVGAEASVWYGAVVRGDGDEIVIGARSNVQDGCVLHTDPGFVLRVGSEVTVGHRAVLHGCTIEDRCLVGMSATVMNGAVIGAGSVVAAGALVPAGTVVPPRSLVLGAPARVRREVSEEEHAANVVSAATYAAVAGAHRRHLAGE